MKESDRDLARWTLYISFLGIFTVSLFALILIGVEYGFGYVEGLGIGAILGVMTKMLSDGWQFFFRKAGTNKKEEK